MGHFIGMLDRRSREVGPDPLSLDISVTDQVSPHPPPCPLCHFVPTDVSFPFYTSLSPRQAPPKKTRTTRKYTCASCCPTLNFLHAPL